MRTRQPLYRSLPALASVSVLMAAGVLVCTDGWAQTAVRTGLRTVSLGQIPSTARLQQTTLPQGLRSSTGINPLAYSDGNGGSSTAYTTAGRLLTITQKDPSAILSWDGFDISADATVRINQKTTDVMLNKVEAGTSRTIIEGVLKADGHVYIYNPNGILFGKTAVVNTNTLVATSLKIDDQRFMAGLLAPNVDPIFGADAAFAGTPGDVVVDGDETQRASLTTDRGGKIMLFAPNVTNKGVLTAPDGQVILAAGGKVYLAAPSDASMRGLLVEVRNDNPGTAGAATNGIENNVNKDVGQIIVERGNATLVGLAVNQMGTVSATTSINLNGSIFLRARDGSGDMKGGEDTPDVAGVKVAAKATQGGNLTLGKNSLTQISVVDDGTTAPAGKDDPAFKKSKIDLSGHQIVLQENALVEARGGDVTIAARENPSVHDLPLVPSKSRVDFGANSKIDVSGMDTATLAMESNVIEVQLLSELADNVLLRDSPLRGKTVRFDMRKGTQIADISKAIAKVEGTVSERTAAAGTVTVTSEGDIIQRQGSKIDVSGGKVDYLAGYVNTSKLTSNGALFDVSTASANKLYDGVADLSDGARNFEAAYSVGKDAGTVQLSAPVIVMQGDIKGTTEIGKYQREVGAAGRPLGGQLIIGAGNADTLSAVDSTKAGFLNNLVIGGTATGSVLGKDETFDAAGNASHASLANRLEIDIVKLKDAGFSRLTAGTAGNIEIAAPVSLAAGGEMKLGAVGDIEFKSGVSTPSGKVTAKALEKLTIHDGAVFDLAGKWTNDSAITNPQRDAAGNPVETIAIKGGELSLSGKKIVIGDDVVADVSGGAWLDASRKLKKGDGGSISIKAELNNSSSVKDSLLQIGNNLDLSGYSLAKGGKLSLQGLNVAVGGGAPVSDTGGGDGSPGPTPPPPTNSDELQYLWLPSKFFENGGFTNYDVSALANFTVKQQSEITPRAQNWQFKDLRTYQTKASGSMRDVASPVMLDLVGPFGGRMPTSVTFSAPTVVDTDIEGRFKTGNLTFGSRATLTTDPGASVTLLAAQQLTMDGTIDAPAGTITVGLTPLPGTDFTYSDKRSIWFGSHAHLLARGTDALMYTDGNGIATGEVLGGGQIRIGRSVDGKLTSATGYVVVEEQNVIDKENEKGATFDVSGVQSGPVRFKSGRTLTAAQPVASAGGSIEIRAREGLLIAGTMKGEAGGAGAQGGSLTIALDRDGVEIKPGYPDDVKRVLTITGGDAQGNIPAGLKYGEKIEGREGQGWLATGSFADGGFDRVQFKSQDVLALSSANGPLALKAKASLILYAPTLEAAPGNTENNVQLDSSYVQLGSADYRYQTTEAATTGAATLNVKATTIDVIGNSSLKGFSAATLDAKEDIRLVGVSKLDLSRAPSTTKPTEAELLPTGELNIAGDLALKAAQIYPTTLSTFTLNAEGDSSKLIFESNGRTAQAPLSAGGNLIGKANTIVQSGRVVAPFGTITLEAKDTLTYNKDSVTSVAGEGLIPFGRVENGRDWIYDFGNGNAVAFKLNPGTSGNLVEMALPEKSILSKAANIIAHDGATLDLAGGGELYAYEFTPGSYGTKDVLKNNDPKSATKVFAINPNYQSSVAPRDFQYGQDGGLLPGDSVYLSGIDGLAAGTYTLLPAHYALLPGGMSITLAPNSRDMSASNNTTNLDGSKTVAGQRTVLGAGDVRSSGWVVSSGDVVRKKSEFHEYAAGDFFKEQAKNAGVVAPMLPGDGGRIQFDATQKLVLDGQVRLGASTGSRRGSADISAPEIVVVSDSAPAPIGDALVLSADKLTALGADSLLLGGLRDRQSDGTYVTVGAKTVTIKNDKDHALSGPEIILAAQDKVQLDAGAVVQGSGILSQVPQNLVIKDTDTSGNTVGTDGALLRVSGGGAVSVTRDAPNRSTGILEINEGATVAATGSAYLDATQDNRMSGRLDLAAGAALGMGANRISLGNDIPQDVEGLHFDGSAIATMSKLSALELSSYSTIDLHGPVNLGDAEMKKLTLKGPGLQGYGTAPDANQRQASFTAETVRFEGGSDLTPSVLPASAGTFAVHARDIEFGNGALAINGYADTKLTATREARAVGTGSVSAEKDLTLAAGRIVANSMADATVQAGNKLVIAQAVNPDEPVGTMPLGGRLHFKGDTIESDAVIRTPAGQVAMTAANGVHITGGEINAGGGSVVFGSTTAYAQAGSIKLDGGAGNVTVDAPATLDVSAVGAAGGTISIKATNGATGKAQLDGTLKGGAIAGVNGVLPTQGSFAMDVDQVGTGGQFDLLNAKLNDGGFAESRKFRVRNDDVTLSAGKNITAHDVIISTDNGSITIGGTIDASGVKGGSIELYASQADASGNSGNVKLTKDAVLDAHALSAASTEAGSTGDGGRVVLGTGSADGGMPSSNNVGSYISIDGGSSINVSRGKDADGNGKGQDGSVTLRAPRIGSGSDVAISNMDATIIGSAETAIEAYKVYKTNNISALANSATNLQVANTSGQPAGTMYTETKTFADNHAGTISSRLGNTSVRAGIEVRSDGDLTISVNETAAKTSAANRGWNMNAWRFDDGQGNSAPGTLTLRAAGDLIVKGSISDGFVKPTTTGVSMPDWALDNKSSWNYRLVGGADFAAASPMAVSTNNDAGDVQIKFARTSTDAKDQPVAMVRTGTGRIDVATGRDVVLDFLGNTDPNKFVGATIYTAGMHKDTVDGSNIFVAPTNLNNQMYGAAANNRTNAEFSHAGGAISIHASRDVLGTQVPQLINNWLFRQGRVDGNGDFAKAGTGANASTLNTAWWSRFDYFNQGIATFGGGDISVIADTGNVKDLSVSVATNAYMPGAKPTNLVEHGGGDLVVRAGGDIQGGVFYAQKGSATIAAEGSIKADSSESGSRKVNGETLGMVLAVGDARFDVRAGRLLELETAFNPMLTQQSKNNSAMAVALQANEPGRSNQIAKLPQLSSFSTYSNDSAVHVTSTTGDVLLSHRNSILADASGNDINSQILGGTYSLLYSYQPGVFSAVAMGGNLSSQNGFTLAGAPKGQLDLLAAGSIDLKSPTTQPIVMLDVSAEKMSSIFAPRIFTLDKDAIDQGDTALLFGSVGGLAAHTSGGLHTGDQQPVRIVALTGDITGDRKDGYEGITIDLPKKAEILAGRDIKDFGFKIQHVAESDVTRIEAGRDFIDSTIVREGDIANPVKHTISGQGRVDFIAGRNVDLGNSSGIVTRGNLDNPYLSSGGASINIVAGSSGADYSKYARNHVAATDLSKVEQDAMVAYVRAKQPDLSTMATTAEIWETFKSLSTADQNAFFDAHKPALNDLFFAKLEESSKIAGLAIFDNQIASLYPNINPDGGNINMFGSQIKTEQGGSIDMFAPGGSVYAGLTSTPSYFTKSASLQGLFTIRGGEIRTLVKDDFLVNQGRVFSLGGGDITGISQYGDLNAGKGEKTASSSPPPLLTTDANGNTKLDISGSISGSGIATLKTDPSLPGSDVIMIAPRGTFDAGDAGVRSTGSVQINASIVLNAGNIAASGSISGAPAVDTGGAGNAAAPAATPKADDIAKDLNNLPATSAGSSNTLSVDVVGYGIDCSDPKYADACASSEDAGKKN